MVKQSNISYLKRITCLKKSPYLAFEGKQNTKKKKISCIERHQSHFTPRIIIIIITVIQCWGAWSYIVQFPLSNL